MLALGSCRFQDLTPAGSRRDEAAVLAVVGSLYQAIGARRLDAMQRITLPSATALLTGDRTPPVLVPMRTMVEVPERRNQAAGVRIVRTELRTDGDIATDRVVVVTRSANGRREFEAADNVVLARRDGSWRVAHVAFGPWKSRSAP